MEEKKDYKCKDCGGLLLYDKEREIYICLNCKECFDWRLIEE